MCLFVLSVAVGASEQHDETGYFLETSVDCHDLRCHFHVRFQSDGHMGTTSGLAERIGRIGIKG